jgi:D-lactate dehydrogenase
MGPVAERVGRGTLPRPAEPLPETTREGAAAVYFPSCTNRIMGRSKRAGVGPTLPDALVAVSARAGKPVWVPPDVAGRCCGVPFSSKGYADAHAEMVTGTVEALWRWSGEGELPVVVDASSCTLGLVAEAADALPDEVRERHTNLEILDSIEWLERLLPDLPRRRTLGRVVVHPTCATRHLGLARRLEALAGELADEAVVPVAATCCGFAGDRGMLHPELTASATDPEARELAERGPFDAYLSTNRTCEIGLERATGEPFGSIVLALEEVTR